MQPILKCKSLENLGQASLTFARCISSSRASYQNVWGRFADELVSRKLNAGKRQYFIDLKRESKSNDDPKKGQLFVKISEKNVQTGKRASTLIDFKDVNTFIQHLKEGFNKEYEAEPYATFPSKMFEHKKHSFFLRENSFGRFIEINESYEQGIRMNMTSKIFINMEHLQNLIDELQLVLSTGESDHIMSNLETG